MNGAKPAGAGAKVTPAQLAQQFFTYSYEKPISALTQNGNTYATGTNLNFDFPIVAGAYATRIQIDYDLTFTFTNGTGSAPTVNASSNSGEGAYGIFQEIGVSYGNRQITAHPYLFKVMGQARGYNRLLTGETLANQSTSIQNAIYKAPTVAAGSNEWKGSIEVPLNAIHPLSPYGLIPMGGSGTRGQLQLVPTTAFTGADPLTSCVNLNGNTGSISALTGTINVTIWYRDWQSFSMPDQLGLDLTGMPTAQILKTAELPLVAGSYQYLRLTNPYPFVNLTHVVIDGQSSSTFCDSQNIAGFRIDAAENTNASLRVFDNTTGGINNYYKMQRRRYGQDFDNGVLMYDARAENVVDSSLFNGTAYLNLTNGGYPAARAGFNVNTVSTANSITPRVVTFGLIQNPIGIH